MLDYLTYRWIHLSGVALVLLGLGASAMHARVGGEPSARKLAAAAHGAGLLLVLVAGFGAMARMDIHWPWPGWLFGKAAIWLILGGLPVVMKKKPALATPLFWITFALFVAAAWLAGAKPFG
jgi:hypothetical protein